MKSITIDDSLSNCCGCGACMSVCPISAITMDTDNYGFVYPKIDEDACIQCGRCTEVCSIQTLPDLQMPIKAYAAVGKNKKMVFNSASGGIFATVAHAAICDDTVVAGAVLEFRDESLDVFHVASKNLNDIQRMQGSKYVQSDAWQCYTVVLDALKKGENVLFSGTPCQVGAIKRLTGNPEKLITMDLICHGVPPKRSLEEYMKILNKRFGGTVDSICFRDKSVKREFTARIGVKYGSSRCTYQMKSSLMSYYDHFLKGIFYREACYNCPYAGIERVSDITIGDFWGIHQYYDGCIDADTMDKDRKWSCILVNTLKGERFMNKYGQNLEIFPTQTEVIKRNNQQLNHPSCKPASADKWIKLYADGGYSAIENRFIREHGGVFRYYWKVWKSIGKFRREKELLNDN